MAAVAAVAAVLVVIVEDRQQYNKRRGRHMVLVEFYSHSRSSFYYIRHRCGLVVVILVCLLLDHTCLLDILVHDSSKILSVFIIS